jgi:Zn-dependent protease
MKNPRLGISLTALAGPVSNLLAAFIGMVVYKLIPDSLLSGNAALYIYYMLQFFISINIGLAVFNLLPIPPLDGDKVLSYFTPLNYKIWIHNHQQIISIVFLVIIFTGLLSYPLGFISNLVWKLLDLLTFWAG